MTHYSEEMNKLKDTILAMASHAESAVARSMRALVERDDTLALKVQEDDNIIDQFEIEVDDLALHLLTKAPLATELRFITVAMKISQNLERVGDEACTIARRAHDLGQEPQLKPYIDLPRMAVAGDLKPGTTVRDRGLRDALAVLEGLPGSLRADVAVAESSGDSQLMLRFAHGPLVVWGDPSRSRAKTLALAAVLARYGQTGTTCTFADVSVPDRVLARPVLK